ncbi:MAG: oxaloacetate decarboxylase [Clostridia bacterium]|nr:oxaloacetate decarboxylase [Clostridia bacterium]
MDFFNNVNPMRFVENLKYMGIGMLGIFIIIGVIMGATYLLSHVSSKKKDK